MHALRNLIPLIWLIANHAHADQWYAGDLHAHSLYSDGDSPVANVIRAAEDAGLDFFSLTDHDTYMTGEPTHWFDDAYVSDALVLLFGVEWTSSRGHANAWSTAPWDYTDMWPANLNTDAAAAAAAAQSAGALFSINHPWAFFIGWDYPVSFDMDCVEIWNGPMLINRSRRATHEFWDDLLLAGRRITGVGGSDTHHLRGWMAAFTAIGQPTTWVYADERNAESILAGIKAGHVSLSYRPDAIRADLTADLDHDDVADLIVGDTHPALGTPVAFQINLAGAGDVGRSIKLPSGVVDRLDRGRLSFWDLIWLALTLDRLGPHSHFVGVIRDGRLYRVWLTDGAVNAFRFEDTPPVGERTYYRVELYGHPDVLGLNRLIYGGRLAITNPIYFNYD